MRIETRLGFVVSALASGKIARARPDCCVWDRKNKCNRNCRSLRPLRGLRDDNSVVGEVGCGSVRRSGVGWRCVGFGRSA